MLAILLLWPFGQTLSAPVPKLCSVTAIAEPLWRGATFNQLTVELDPDCPDDGYARIQLGSYGGAGSAATGRVEIMTPKRPRLIWAAQPRWRTVLWLAWSGKPY